MSISSHKYSRLSNIERGKVELLQNKGVSFIARELGRSKSSVFEELKRGTYNGRYSASIAHNRALQAKLLCKKRQKIEDKELMSFIEIHIKKYWSPEIIAHMWTGGSVSGKTIRTIIRKHRREWRKYLMYQKKTPYHKGTAGKSLIPDRIDISLRPEVKFGDWEADTVLPGKGGKSVLAVFVEKTTRLYKIVKIPEKTAKSMVFAAVKALKGFYVRSITYDNGSENAKHMVINCLLKCKSLFCRVYRSGDKGLVERKNRDLRQYLKKGTKFDLLEESELVRIETEINERPMKCLNWLSPIQAFNVASAFG